MLTSSPYDIHRTRQREGTTGPATSRGDSTRSCGRGDVLDQYPADLLLQPFTPTEDRGSNGDAWWLAHTLPRQEKAVAGALASQRVSYYLPLVCRKSLTRGRTRVARVPLFAGYLFMRGNEENRLQVLKTNRVLTVHQVPDGEELRRDLQQFAQLIARGAPLVPEARLVAGDRVRVKAGPFCDSEGVVIRRSGKTRLLVAVNYLQQGASLEVDDYLLAPI